eukprot:scaffold53490_cov36-Phaeocystis_antarctica.AAC.1
MSNRLRSPNRSHSPSAVMMMPPSRPLKLDCSDLILRNLSPSTSPSGSSPRRTSTESAVSVGRIQP